MDPHTPAKTRCDAAVWHGENRGECGQEPGPDGQCPDHPADPVVDCEIIDAGGTEYLGFVRGANGETITAGLENGHVALYLNVWLSADGVLLDGAQQRRFRALFDACCARDAAAEQLSGAPGGGDARR
jgi:hypothetical protein